jgi:hypothetical protein
MDSPRPVISLTRPFLAARSYWLKESLVFAPREARGESNEPLSESEVSRVKPNASAMRAFFRDERDFWRIGYEGRWIAVRSLKGFVYLEYLLLHPEEKVPVFQLAALDDQRWSEFAGTGAGGIGMAPLPSTGQTNAGDVLDGRARREYRARLADLRAELDEALHWADLERADSIRIEIDFISTELARAFGRHGRARKMSDPMERVRKAVTNRIHDAIARIAGQHPSLGRHLRNSIRTGFSCWYSPESRVVWTSDPRLPLGTAV